MLTLQRYTFLGELANDNYTFLGELLSKCYTFLGELARANNIIRYKKRTTRTALVLAEQRGKLMIAVDDYFAHSCIYYCFYAYILCYCCPVKAKSLPTNYKIDISGL